MTAPRRIRQALRALDAAIARGEVVPTSEEAAAIACLRAGADARIRRPGRNGGRRAACIACDGPKQRDDFNASVPPGARVRVWPFTRTGPGEVCRTASEAWCLGDGTPVVKVGGHSGGIALSHIEVIS